ncbi:MAG: nitroreductase family protein, partial [Bdellovibrio sp. CG10_big_fil_rev_8_21_14_0_10_47_8]
MSELFNNIFDPQLGTHQEPPEIDAAEFEKVVLSRRSVRRYTKDPVPPEIMLKILELGLRAPNSSNLQPWDFYWVRTPEKREAINTAFLSQPAATTAAEIIVAVARTGTWKKNARQMLGLLHKHDAKPPKSVLSYYNKIVPMAYTVGPFGVLGWLKKIIFFGAGFFTPTPREPTSASHMRIWAAKSTALACENIMLAARAYSFDSCPMEGMDSTRVRKILNLQRDAFVVMGISIGKRA